MPTYQYACTACGDQLEVVQKFSDDPLSECASCGGRLRKVFSAVGVVFKGSGFYRNDSRTDHRSSSNGSAAKEDSTSEKSESNGKAEQSGTSSAGSGDSGAGSSGSSSSGSTDGGSGSGKKAAEKAA